MLRPPGSCRRHRPPDARMRHVHLLWAVSVAILLCACVSADTSCDPGYYPNNDDCQMCSLGRYCEGGTTDRQSCGPGFYQNEWAQASCKDDECANECAVGKYNDVRGATSESWCKNCRPGRYCPSSGTSYGWNCGKGRHNPDYGATSSDDCLDCPAGTHCPYDATWHPNDCPTGTFNPGTRATSLSGCQDCTAGNYCNLEGMSSPNTCPPGTFNSGTGAITATACASCTKGHYCPHVSMSSPTKCPAGRHQPYMSRTNYISCKVCREYTYAAQASSTCTWCAPGKYNTGLAKSSCSKCPAGKWVTYAGDPNEPGTAGTAPSPCFDAPAGKYSNQVNNPPVLRNCPAGRYSLGGAAAATSCTVCANGKWSNPGRTIACSTDCPGGQFCSGGNQLPCSPGHYCPQGTTSEQDCPAGRFHATGGIASYDQCTQCDTGFFCVGGRSSAEVCTPGRFQNQVGQSSCKNCNKGHYCVAPFKTKTPCPVGRFGPTRGLQAMTSCTQCGAGYYCAQGAQARTACASAAVYCPGDTGSAQVVPEGSYSWPLTADGTLRSSTKQCEAGHYCTAGVKTQCPAGKFQDEPGQNSCIGCPTGHYCPLGEPNKQPCPAGKHNPLPDSTSLAACVACTVEHFCLLGTTTPSACPDGTHGPRTNHVSAADCPACPAGYYCTAATGAPIACGGVDRFCAAGVSAPTAVAPGYYTTPSTDGVVIHQTAQQACDQGHYCPGGDRQPCAAGRYSLDTLRQTACAVDCPLGRYCETGAGSDGQRGAPCPAGVVGNATGLQTSACAAPCPLGHYCEVETVTPAMCPPGRYRDTLGAKSSSECPECPAGFYCGLGTATPTPCGAAHLYCPVGSETPTNVTTGFYSLPVDEPDTQRTDQTACPPGSYCIVGVRYLCAAGTMSDLTMRRVPCDQLCSPGTWCPAGSFEEVPCEAGTYSGDTGRPVACSNVCPVGTYCPQGAIQPTNCSAGFWNNATGAGRVEDCLDCQPGWYCPQRSALPTPCAAGTYHGGFNKPTPCTELCPFAHYCPLATAVPPACPAGRFGEIRGLQDAGCSGPCRVAHFCPEETTAPIACPGGVYGNVTSLSTADCAGICPAGYVCSSPTDQPDVECGDVSLYCPAGSATKSEALPGEYTVGGTTTTRHGVLPCPPGSYCDEGLRRPCPAGSYGNTSRLSASTCSGDCAAGFVCPAGSASSMAQPCGGVAVYCPVGSGSATTVSAGFYSAPLSLPEDVRTSQLQCEPGTYCVDGDRLLCAAGRWSSDLRRQAPCVEPCPAGYYCPEGTGVAFRFPCGSVSKYCPPQSPQPVDVEPGRYSVGPTEQTRNASLPCPPSGVYCTGSGNIDVCPTGTFGNASSLSTPACSGACAAGYFCARGSTSPTAAPCGSANVYCPEGTDALLAVPPGAFSLPDDAPVGTRHAVQDCAPGEYCVDGIRFECAVGTYNPSPRRATPCTTECPAGYFCPVGTAVPSVRCDQPAEYCPQGVPAPITAVLGEYSLQTPERLYFDVASCEAGYYCAGGVRRACAAGRFGAAPRLGTPTCSGECEAGSYCPPASVSGTEQTCTGPEFYCPQGTPVRVAVPAGGYSTPEGDAHLSNRTGAAVCPLGWFCEYGLRSRCPSGRYGASAGLDSELCSGPCAEGYFCPPRSSSPTQEPCGGPHVYCPTGTAERLVVQPGEYSTGGTSSTRSNTVACPMGAFCTDGVRSPCPAGRFGCSLHVFDPLCNGPCAAGFYCPTGSTSNQAVACGSDPLLPTPQAMFCASGSSVPTPVTVGYYSVGGSTPDRQSSQLQCEPGTYCVDGVRQECAAGRYGTTHGLFTDACTGVCDDGYECPAGSSSARQQPCPPGHFCAAGAVDACPPGRYNNFTLASSVAACMLCPANTAFSGTAATSVAQCQPCVPPEGSTAGATTCWPGIVSVAAANPPPLVVGHGVGDQVVFTFTRRTNQPDVASHARVAAAVRFSASIGQQLRGQWARGGTQLVVTIMDSDGAHPDPDRYEIGNLTATVLASAGITDADATSPPHPDETLLVGGSWGVPSAPTIASATAFDTGKHAGLGAGDQLVVVFDQEVAQLPVATVDDVMRVFHFSALITTDVTGRWLSRTAVVLTFGGDPPAAVRPAQAVGTFTVATRPTANLTSFNGQSDASDSAATVSLGTWGDPPVVVVEHRSGVSIRVRLNASAYVTHYPTPRFLVQWEPDTAATHPFSQLWTPPDWASVCNASSAAAAACSASTPGLHVLAQYPDKAGTAVVFAVGVPQSLAAAEVNEDGVAVLLGDGEPAVYDPAASSVSVDIPGLRTNQRYRVRAAADNLGHVGPWAVSSPPDITPQAPLVTGVSTRNTVLSATGGQVMDVTGLNLGRVGDPVAVHYANARYNLTATDCAVRTDFVRVTCLSVPGVGHSFQFAVQVDGAWSAWSGADVTLSYAAPSVSGFEGDGVAGATTEGQQGVTIYGTNFGPTSMSPLSVDAVTYSPLGANYSFTAVNCSVIQDDTVLSCFTAPGVGRLLAWSVTIGDQLSSLPVTHYAVPVVDVVGIVRDGMVRTDHATLVSLDTAGGEELVLRGSNLGHHNALLGVFGPAVSARNPAGVLLVAVDCYVAVPHVEVRCTTPSGLGQFFPWRVEVGGQQSPAPDDLASYAPPVVTVVAPTAITTRGGLTVRLTGQFFGDSPDAVHLVLGGGTKHRTEAAVRIVEPHRVMVFAAPEGEGWHTDMRLTVGGQPASVAPGFNTSLRLQYLDPIIKVARIATNTSDSAADTLDCSTTVENRTQGVELVLTGANFGHGEDTRVTIGATKDECVMDMSVSSHTFISCITSQCEGVLTLTVAGQRQTTMEYNYRDLVALPFVKNFEPRFGPAAGNTTLVITGTDFKSAGTVLLRALNPVTGVYTGVEAECQWQGIPGMSYDRKRIVCRTPPGTGSQHDVVVVAAKVESEPALMKWGYLPPSVSDIQPTTLAPQGNVVATLTGVNFGMNADGLDIVRVGGARCDPVLSWSDTVIMCVLPPATSEATEVVVVVDAQESGVGSQAARVSYNPPVVAAIAPDTGPTAGGRLITVTGHDFAAPFPVRVWFTRTQPSLMLVSDLNNPVHDLKECVVVNATPAAINCTQPEAAGSGWFVMVQNLMPGDEDPVTTSRLSANSIRFTYYPPVVSGVDVLDEARPAIGDFLVRINGSDLSLAPSIAITGAPCVLATTHPSSGAALTNSHSVVHCVAPPRIVDMPNTLRLEVDVFADEAPFEYDSPVVSSLSPNRVDGVDRASRQRVRLLGTNFGDPSTGAAASHEVFIDGESRCRLGPVWEADGVVRCTVDGDLLVGPHNVSIVVGGQQSVLSPSSPLLRAECFPTFFGRAGEFCLPCPPGAECPGGDVDPQALPGFYPQFRDAFPKCYPAEACVGDNVEPCASAYVGLRCSECAVNHYRLQGRCKKCPDLAWMLFVGFAALVAVLVAGSVYLSKKRINLAGLSIGVDFLQVLSMLSSFEFDWPVALTSIYSAVSLTNFNIELMAPECSFSVNYTQKWAVVQAIPLLLLAVVCTAVAVVRVARWCHRSCPSVRHAWRKVQRRAANSDDSNAMLSSTSSTAVVDAAIGVAINGLYYSYFVVVRNALGPLDCTKDDAGVAVMDIEPSVRCHEPGGVHEAILPWAILSLVVYGMGIPLVFGTALYRNHGSIAADQAMRVKGEGNTPETNPYLRTRRRLRKLYEDFRPDMFFWRLALIGRKFLLAVTTMMFNGNPMFQASLTIAVLFAAYVMHERLKPFLQPRSVSQDFTTLTAKRRTGIVAHANPLLAAGNSSSGSDLTDPSSQQPSRQRPSRLLTAALATAGGTGTGQQGAATPPTTASPRGRVVRNSVVVASLQARSRVVTFIVNYNHLESVLLITSMCILLGGMIFSSAAFAPGSFPYIVLTVAVAAAIIISTTVFTALLSFEVYRAIRYSKLHSVAARVELESKLDTARVQLATPASHGRHQRRTGTPRHHRLMHSPELAARRGSVAVSANSAPVASSSPSLPS